MLSCKISDKYLFTCQNNYIYITEMFQKYLHDRIKVTKSKSFTEI